LGSKTKPSLQAQPSLPSTVVTQICSHFLGFAPHSFLVGQSFSSEITHPNGSVLNSLECVAALKEAHTFTIVTVSLAITQMFSTNTRSRTIATGELRFFAGGGTLLLVLALGTIFYSVTQPSFL
jgi:hypothetical protein